MIGGMSKILNKLDSLTDFIPIFKFDSMNIKDVEHTMYINKNRIYAFSHFKHNDKECLLLKFDKNTIFQNIQYVRKIILWYLMNYLKDYLTNYPNTMIPFFN